MRSPTEKRAASRKQFCRRTRREFLWQAGAGFTALGLTDLLDTEGFFTSQSLAADDQTPFINPLAPKKPHFAGKAEHVIFLFMFGGPSHMDTFDYKPDLYPLEGKTIKVKTFGRGGRRNESRAVAPRWKADGFPKRLPPKLTIGSGFIVKYILSISPKSSSTS